MPVSRRAIDKGNEIRDSLKEVYIDRDREIEQFDKYLKLVQDAIDKRDVSESDEAPYYVLHLQGVGGVGKSVIKEQLIKRHKDDFIYASFCFKNYSSTEDMIYKIVEQLEGFKTWNGLMFPLVQAYKERMNDQSESEKKRYYSTFNRILDLSRRTLNEAVPGAGKAVAKDITEKIPNGIDYGRLIGTKHGRQYLNDIQTKSSDEDVKESLVDYFRDDMARIMEKTKKTVVIFVDTYEKIEKDCDDYLKGQEWIWDLVDIPFMLWVFLGRKKLRSLDDCKYGQKENGWDDIIGEDEEIKVKNFDEEKSREYLKEVGINNEGIVKRFIELSEGNPQHLRNLCNVYDNYCHSEGKNKGIDPNDPNSYSMDEKMYERYIENLDKDRELGVLRTLSLFSDGWTDEVLERTGVISPENEIYEDLIRNSLIEVDSLEIGKGNRYRISNSIRNLLLQQWRKKEPGEYLEEESKIHIRLKDYYIEKIESIVTAFDNLDPIYDLLSIFKDDEKEHVLDDVLFEKLKMIAKARRFSDVDNILGFFKGSDSLLVSTSIQCIRGYVHEQDREYEKAWNEYTAAYESRRDVFKKESRYTLQAMAMLAMSYYYTKKTGDDGLAFGKECVELCRENLEPDDEVLFDAEYALSSVLILNEKYKESLDLNKQLHRRVVKKKGIDDPRSFSMLNAISADYSYLGKIKTSFDIDKKCYERRKAKLGEDHPDTLQSLNKMGYDYSNLGNHQEALEIDKRCYELRKAKLGENHPDTLWSLNNMGSDYSDLGNHQEALEIDKRCYELRKAKLGENHPDTLWSLNNMGSDYRLLKKYEEALETDKMCYELRKARLGEDHPDTLLSLKIMGVDYRHFFKYEEALETDKKCYERIKAKKGEDDPDTLMLLEDISHDYRGLGKYQEALELDKQCYELIKAKKGEDDPDTFMLLEDIRFDYSNLGKYQEALDIDKKCYELRKAKLGEDDPLTLWSLHNMGGVYREFGKYQEALDIDKKCYELRKAKLGEDDPDTLFSLESIRNDYYCLGKDKEALDTYELINKLRNKLNGYDRDAWMDFLFSFEQDDEDSQKDE